MFRRAADTDSEDYDSDLEPYTAIGGGEGDAIDDELAAAMAASLQMSTGGGYGGGGGGGGMDGLTEEEALQLAMAASMGTGGADASLVAAVDGDLTEEEALALALAESANDEVRPPPSNDDDGMDADLAAAIAASQAEADAAKARPPRVDTSTAHYQTTSLATPTVAPPSYTDSDDDDGDNRYTNAPPGLGPPTTSAVPEHVLGPPTDPPTPQAPPPSYFDSAEPNTAPPPVSGGEWGGGGGGGEWGGGGGGGGGSGGVVGASAPPATPTVQLPSDSAPLPPIGRRPGPVDSFTGGPPSEPPPTTPPPPSYGGSSTNNGDDDDYTRPPPAQDFGGGGDGGWDGGPPSGPPPSSLTTTNDEEIAEALSALIAVGASEAEIAAALSGSCGGGGGGSGGSGGGGWEDDEYDYQLDEALARVLAETPPSPALATAGVDTPPPVARADVDREMEGLVRDVPVQSFLPSIIARATTMGPFRSQREFAAARSRLRRRLGEYGLGEIPVAGNGNCQFAAISDQLYRSQAYHDVIRQQVVQYLADNRSRYAIFVQDEPYDVYVTRMSQPRQWGDHVTLQAAADCFGVQINLITSEQDGVMRVTPKSREPERTLWLSYIYEFHYASVYPLEQIENEVRLRREAASPERGGNCSVM